MRDIVFSPVPAGLTGGKLSLLAKAILGMLMTGASQNSRGLVLHVLESATADDLDKVRRAVELYGVMQVTSDKNAIASNDVDMATLTCSDARIAGDSKVDLRVYLNNTLYAEDVVDVVLGAVTLEFTTGAPGNYVFEIVRRRGNFASGVKLIEAVE